MYVVSEDKQKGGLCWPILHLQLQLAFLAIESYTIWDWEVTSKLKGCLVSQSNTVSCFWVSPIFLLPWHLFLWLSCDISRGDIVLLRWWGWWRGRGRRGRAREGIEEAYPLLGRGHQTPFLPVNFQLFPPALPSSPCLTFKLLSFWNSDNHISMECNIILENSFGCDASSTNDALSAFSSREWLSLSRRGVWERHVTHLSFSPAFSASLPHVSLSGSPPPPPVFLLTLLLLCLHILGIR